MVGACSREYAGGQLPGGSFVGGRGVGLEPMHLYVRSCTHACVYVPVRACMHARVSVFRLGMRMLCILAAFAFSDWPSCFGVCETFLIQCVQGHLQADKYARIVSLYNVFRCSSVGGTGISVNNVRGILSTKIPHKPTVTTTPKYRCSLNQVLNSRYRTGVKPKPWFRPQL